jgi:adenylate cyclase
VDRSIVGSTGRNPGVDVSKDADTHEWGSPPASTPANEVREELARVLAGPDFRGSERASRFLRFVVEETLDSGTTRLKAYTIATRLLGRPQNFDPVTDPIVRTQASRVRRSLEHYYLTAGAPNPVRIVLPPGTYRPVFSVPFTHQGVSSPRPPSEDDFLAEPIIAVIPFTDSTSDGSLASFVHELAQDAALALARFEGFRVLPPSAWQEADDVWVAKGDVASKPAARFLLRGRADYSGHRVRVTVVLHEAQTGEVLWSLPFVRVLRAERAHVVRREISRRVACQVADITGVIARFFTRRLSPQLSQHLPLHEAVFLYNIVPVRTIEQFVEFRALMEAAMERAPDSAFINAMLGIVCVHDYGYMFATMDHPLDRAVSLARRAVALEPGSQLAQGILAYVYAHRQEPEQCRAHAERCIELNPDASYWVGLTGLSMALCCDWERALPLVRRAMDLNPGYMRYLHFPLFIDHFRRGQYQKALAEVRLFDVSGFYRETYLRAAALGKLGLIEEGRTAISELLALRPDFLRNGRELVRRLVMDEQVLDDVMDGLRRAGLSI